MVQCVLHVCIKISFTPYCWSVALEKKKKGREEREKNRRGKKKGVETYQWNRTLSFKSSGKDSAIPLKIPLLKCRARVHALTCIGWNNIKMKVLYIIMLLRCVHGGGGGEL